jgi:signal transduction histidine kinase
MERAEALALLGATAPDDRLRGARTLVRTCLPEDAAALQSALQNETNKWVKSALKKALLSLETESSLPVKAGADDEEERIIDQITAEAVEETTKRLVHEIRPILGRLDVAARGEVPDYDASDTRAQWARLERLLIVVDKLSHAASAPIYKDFNLPGVLDGLIAAEGAGSAAHVQCAGPKPFVVWSDATFVEIIVANAIRNAVEASAELPQGQPIVVTWGATDCDYWIAVLDRGCGLPAGSQKIFEMGSTTKKGHFGMGLATAKQAALSLNGKISLVPREQGGVRFEFAWPKPAK